MFLVRAANTGISAIIAPDGRVLGSLAFGRAGVITADVQAMAGATPAVVFGGAIRAGVVLVAAGVMILGARRRQISR